MQNIQSNLQSTSLGKSRIFYLLTFFNLLFLAYIITVGQFNRLAMDDFAFVGIYDEYGIWSPFTYWYWNWQGRFAPQLMTNVIVFFYKYTSSLTFYAIALSTAIVFLIYRILKVYIQMPNIVLFNISVSLFSAIFLTTFEPSTFFWVCASAGYFGGMTFALWGVLLLIENKASILRHLLIAICFVYVASSSEHVGFLACTILGLVLAYNLFNESRVAGNLRQGIVAFFANTQNRKLTTAFIFAAAAFVVMVMAPGTDVRLSVLRPEKGPIDLLLLTLVSTVQVLLYIFYKLPQIALFVPLFIWLGAHFPAWPARVKVKSAIKLGAALMLFVIFIASIPVTYAIGHLAPLRAYVFVSFFLVATVFAVCVYAGMYSRNRFRKIPILSAFAITGLIAIVVYMLFTEAPLLKKYQESVDERIALLEEFKKQGRTEPVYVEPLFNPQYQTVMDLWRKVTFTSRMRCKATDMPLLTEDISTQQDWRNNQFKDGLDLPFDVYVESPEHPKTELDPSTK